MFVYLLSIYLNKNLYNKEWIEQQNYQLDFVECKNLVFLEIEMKFPRRVLT